RGRGRAGLRLSGRSAGAVGQPRALAVLHHRSVTGGDRPALSSDGAVAAGATQPVSAYRDSRLPGGMAPGPAVAGAGLRPVVRADARLARTRAPPRPGRPAAWPVAGDRSAGTAGCVPAAAAAPGLDGFSPAQPQRGGTVAQSARSLSAARIRHRSGDAAVRSAAGRQPA